MKTGVCGTQPTMQDQVVPVNIAGIEIEIHDAEYVGRINRSQVRLIGKETEIVVSKEKVEDTYIEVFLAQL